jgi:hypothetical protein
VQWAAAAATILSTGFEHPFVPGNLIDQNGWKSAGTGFSTATVVPNIGISNSQAVQVLRVGNSDRRWAVPHLVGLPSQRFVAIDWDMKVFQAADPSQSGFGPFFGIDTYDDTPPPGAPAGSPPSVLGALGVDASTGDVLYQLGGSGALTETGITVPFAEWNHYRIVLDFATDTYYGLVNGTVRSVTPFVDDRPSFELDNFTDADIAAFAAAGDMLSQSLSSNAVFDNFLVRDGLVGDYDIDGDVDLDDYKRWRANYGLSPGNNADGNGNGIVDAADYVVWRNNLGRSLFSGLNGAGAAITAAGAVAAVPEPTSMVLGLLGLPVVALLLRRHQRADTNR